MSNAQSLTDPHGIISIGSAAATAEQVTQWLAAGDAAALSRPKELASLLASHSAFGGGSSAGIEDR